ncbi:hsp90 co-chaperone Hch1p [[Candida] railenensis]|uniref:Hsp90 co-chaperone Hch1p n=1 Tax=[Candida] railenensis TaxID=45579 RepID=A0A9P0QPN6_9ASCO|nr:hsp90 co-chaperone Hch1p [[Candida] railenensis]
MVVHNPNNWHWVDKNCLSWSKTYLEKEIINTTYTHDTITYTLTDINSVTGDCDVTQRKGKVLCIYDMKLEFAYKGVQDEDEFTGKIILPEFIHDQEEDEYEFSIDSDSHKSEVRKHFIPVLKQKLMKFQNDLLRAHEKDVQHTSS